MLTGCADGIAEGEFVVERYIDADWDEVVSAYDECFAHLMIPGEDRESRIRALPAELEVGGWVARSADGIVGIGIAGIPATTYDMLTTPMGVHALIAAHPDGHDYDDVERVERTDTSSEWLRYLPGAWLGTGLGVRVAWRGRGVARALVAARLEEARRRDARAFMVGCVVGSGSDALYRSLGFEVVYRMSDFYVGGHDMEFLALRLGPPVDVERTIHLTPSTRLLERWRRRVGAGVGGVAAAVGLCWLVPSVAYLVGAATAVVVVFGISAGLGTKPTVQRMRIPGE